jgi:hypothetical protein
MQQLLQNRMVKRQGTWLADSIEAHSAKWDHSGSRRALSMVRPSEGTDSVLENQPSILARLRQQTLMARKKGRTLSGRTDWPLDKEAEVKVVNLSAGPNYED